MTYLNQSIRSLEGVIWKTDRPVSFISKVTVRGTQWILTSLNSEDTRRGVGGEGFTDVSGISRCHRSEGRGLGWHRRPFVGRAQIKVGRGHRGRREDKCRRVAEPGRDLRFRRKEVLLKYLSSSSLKKK